VLGSPIEREPFLCNGERTTEYLAQATPNLTACVIVTRNLGKEVKVRTWLFSLIRAEH